MLKKAIALLGSLFISMSVSASAVLISGSISGGTGALATLAPPGTAFAGDLDWTGSLVGAKVTLGGFCFTDDASGLNPTTSPTCGSLAVVPLLTTGSPVYNGTPAPPGATFQQAGTTFNGSTGVLKLIAYSPSFSVNVAIDLTFNGDGTGSVSADAGALGTATGAFTVDNFGPPGSTPSRGNNAIPVMPGFVMVLTGLGLALVAHRRLRKMTRRG